MFLGLRTVIYPTPDLESATTWWTGVLGLPPYFSEPFYVGYSVGGYELGLLPESSGGAARVYWGVPDAGAALADLLAAGAAEGEPVTDVGGGIRTASAVAPDGSVVGVIENPGFALRPVVEAGEGPGR